jgi:hypothetical protein
LKKACGLKCKYKCCTKFTEGKRENMFRSFWALGDITKQRQFLFKYAVNSEKKRGHVSFRKKYSFKYYLPSDKFSSVRVCKLFFLRTLGISQQMVLTAHEKIHTPGVVSQEGRGKSEKSRSNKIPEQALDFIRQHINSFKTTDSHYCRKDSMRKYLDSNLNIQKLYELYCAKCSREGVIPEKN